MMPIPSFFGNTMKTRSSQEYNIHAVDKHAVVDADTVEEESTGESSLQKSSMSRTLRRVDQNAKAAFRTSVIKDAVKELTTIRSKNGGRAIYGDFKKVLKKYEKYKIVTRSAVSYRLKINEDM